MRKQCLAIGGILIGLASSSHGAQVETLPTPPPVAAPRTLVAPPPGVTFGPNLNVSAPPGNSADDCRVRQYWQQAVRRANARYEPDYGATHGWSPCRSSGRWDPSQARD